MRVIIVGGGQVGSYLASLLAANGHEIKIIEHRSKSYHKLQKEFPAKTLLFGYGSDPAILEEAGIGTADVVAAVTADDEINLVVTTLAKMEFGVPRVIGRASNPKNAWLYNSSMGVDVVVNQADLIARLVMEEMDLDNMFTLMKLNRGEYDIVQTKVLEDSRAKDQYIKDLPIPKKVVLISITRNDEVLIPKGDTKILAGDELLILTNEESKQPIQELFG